MSSWASLSMISSLYVYVEVVVGRRICKGTAQGKLERLQPGVQGGGKSPLCTDVLQILVAGTHHEIESTGATF